MRNGNIEFELIYNMNNAVNLNIAHHRKSLEYLNVSLVIYDVNEEELLLTGTPSVEYGWRIPDRNWKGRGCSYD